MTITLNGSTGINTPGVVNTAAETIATTLAVTGVTTIAAGSAAAPALVGTTGGATTGIFFPAADTIAFAEGGAEAMRIDSSGNVGIGTSSPSSKFDVVGGRSTFSANSENFSVYLRYNNSTNGFYIGSPSADAMVFSASSGAERARIDSTGQFLVGCTVLPASGRTKGFGARTNTTGGFQVYQTSSVSDWAISVTSGSCVNFYSDNGSALVYAGSINVSGSTTSYTSVSDYRLKENVQPMTGALANVLALKPVTFTFKDSGQDSQGFIAHELQAVVPDAVTGIKDAVREEQYEVTPAVKDADGNTITEAVMGTRTVPDYQGIDTSFLVATLTAAIQELNTRLTALENK